MKICLFHAGCLLILYSPEVWSKSSRSWKTKFLPQSLSHTASQGQEEYDKTMLKLQEDESAPSLVIAGGGPAGLLAAIMLGNLGIKTTVLERSSGPDQWTQKSYSIVLNERGTSALKKAGPDVLKTAMKFGSERKFTYMFDGETGVQQTIPKETPSIVFTRPLLVQCLEEIASRERNIDLRKGVCISEVRSHASKKSPLTLKLDDGSEMSATHVIGADGKWSKVRQSFVELESQVEICTENFGVHWTLSTTPDEFKRDGAYICTAPGERLFYILAIPIPNGQMSVTMVCFDETVEKYTWLGDTKQESHNVTGWENDKVQDYSNQDLRQNLGLLLQEKVPHFFEAIGRHDAIKTARINRRGTWLKYATTGGKNASYATATGTVVLIGDAAHGMTAALGEGCNTALESAVKLVEAVVSEMINDEDENNSRTAPASRHLTAAFVKYGISRPKDVIPIQEMSASRGRLSRK